jgi:hypothetical protein
MVSGSSAQLFRTLLTNVETSRMRMSPMSGGRNAGPYFSEGSLVGAPIAARVVNLWERGLFGSVPNAFGSRPDDDPAA